MAKTAQPSVKMAFNLWKKDNLRNSRKVWNFSSFCILLRLITLISLVYSSYFWIKKAPVYRPRCLSCHILLQLPEKIYVKLLKNDYRFFLICQSALHKGLPLQGMLPNLISEWRTTISAKEIIKEELKLAFFKQNWSKSHLSHWIF